MALCRPVEILMDEHRIIERVLEAMRRFANELNAGGTVETAKLAGLVPFMREFADGQHHGKEEHRLFPRLLEKGLPTEHGPVQVMCSEHEIGRRMVGELESAVANFDPEDEALRHRLAAAMIALVEFYTQHIWKEDNILFPMADRVLDKSDVDGMITAFDDADGPDGTERRKRAIEFAESLA